VEPSILLHPLDFLGAEDVPSLGFFPAMQMTAAEKVKRVEHCLDQMQTHFDVRSMGEHAAAATARASLPVREAKFRD
jgi:hypothetical protein